MVPPLGAPPVVRPIIKVQARPTLMLPHKCKYVRRTTDGHYVGSLQHVYLIFDTITAVPVDTAISPPLLGTTAPPVLVSLVPVKITWLPLHDFTEAVSGHRRTTLQLVHDADGSELVMFYAGAHQTAVFFRLSGEVVRTVPLQWDIRQEGTVVVDVAGQHYFTHGLPAPHDVLLVCQPDGSDVRRYPLTTSPTDSPNQVPPGRTSYRLLAHEQTTNTLLFLENYAGGPYFLARTDPRGKILQRSMLRRLLPDDSTSPVQLWEDNPSGEHRLNTAYNSVVNLVAVLASSSDHTHSSALFLVDAATGLLVWYKRFTAPKLRVVGLTDDGILYVYNGSTAVYEWQIRREG